MVVAAALTAVRVQSGLSKADLLGQVNMGNSYPEILHGEILWLLQQYAFPSWELCVLK